MLMRHSALFLLIAALLTACGSGRPKPDVSKIEVKFNIERFDRDFFALDTSRLPEGLAALEKKYGSFLYYFTDTATGIGAYSDTSRLLLRRTSQFLNDFRLLADTLGGLYKNTDWLEEELKTGFKFAKHYFPAFKIPRVITTVEPFSPDVINGSFYNNGVLSIGLQMYLGVGAPQYDPQFYPDYLSKKFDRRYMVANCMQALIEQQFYPFGAYDRPLVEQMIEKGKQWWLLDKLLPDTPDTIKTGYTAFQLNGCRKSEGLLWNHFNTRVDLYSTDQQIIQTYMGEAPFTEAPGFPQDSPGSIGAWTGWQIVKAYEEKTGKSMQEILNTPPRALLEAAKYKPK